MTEEEVILKEIRDKLDENRKLLQEIARWSRFQNINKLKEVLTAELDSNEKKLAFENTDGKKGINEIAKACGAPRDTVYSWWRKWSHMGILEPSESREGRLVKICSLEDVGIKIPRPARLEEKIIAARVTAADGIAKEETVDSKDAGDGKALEEVQK